MSPLPRFPPFAAPGLALALWLAGFWFFARHHDFPIYYHPDESSKGQQIISGELNFHHPLLLLDTASLWLRASGEPRTVENAVLAGRWMSAVFASTAVLALTVLAWRRGGWPAALLAALLIPLHPLIYELAHYCKEDPALLAGLSLTLLALDFFLAAPSAHRAAWLGAAAGLAVSGKYLGVITLLMALPFLYLAGRREKRKNGENGGKMGQLFAAFALAWLGVVLLINLPYFLHPSALQKGLSYELHAASLGGTKGLSRDVPHGKYVGIFLANVGWPLWLGLGLLVAGWFWRRPPRRATDVLLLLFPLAYTLLLSFSPKTASRYFLAVAPFLILGGILGFVWLARVLGSSFRPAQWIALLLCAVAALDAQWQLVAPSLEGMRTDSRREMAAWIGKNLPAQSSMLAESRIHLSNDLTWQDLPRPKLVLQEQPFVPDRGSLAELQARGVRYVTVIRTSFGGFMDEKRKPVKSLEDQHERRSQFYHQLFAEGKLLKTTGGKGVGILNPEIRLYEIAPPSRL